jgi:ribosome-associated protein
LKFTPEKEARTLQRSLPNSPPPSPSTQVSLPASRAARGCWSVFDPAYEALVGTHRIQRVPATEKRGRRHSSEVTVVALRDAESTGVEVRREDVRVDTYRASGAGGQHRNKTDSAVRMTHLPTGIVVTATEERSQHQNRTVAWQRLTDLLAGQHEAAAHARTNTTRRDAIEEGRSWTWTGWRDEVKGPGGRRTQMSRALAGRLTPLL